ncbi:MAG: hypothetical protein DMG77_16690 [Acidobacteria bacterium]|nr:MAG: hypothetical protein DMG77_16690 [Acidobacteriota bacterium]
MPRRKFATLSSNPAWSTVPRKATTSLPKCWRPRRQSKSREAQPVCEIVLRVGGHYRYVWRRDKDGTEMGMSGVHQEVVPPERIVATEKFDQAWYAGEAVNTTVLVEQGGKTTLTQTVLYQSREARDGVLQSGMERGVAASYDRLEKLLETVETRTA